MFLHLGKNPACAVGCSLNCLVSVFGSHYLLDEENETLSCGESALDCFDASLEGGCSSLTSSFGVALQTSRWFWAEV